MELCLYCVNVNEIGLLNVVFNIYYHRYPNCLSLSLYLTLMTFLAILIANCR